MTKVTHKFEAGESYGTRSTVDADTVIGVKIERRTKLNVWIKIGTKLVRRNVRIDTDGVERFDPFGRYSMSPVISADKLLHSVLMGKDKQPPAAAPAPKLRAYQERAIEQAARAVAAPGSVFITHKRELIPQRPTGRAVAALKASAADIATAANDELAERLNTNRFAHAVEFVSRFMTSTGSQQVDREHVRAFLDIISIMDEIDFTDLDLIRRYLRGE